MMRRLGSNVRYNPPPSTVSAPLPPPHRTASEKSAYTESVRSISEEWQSFPELIMGSQSECSLIRTGTTSDEEEVSPSAESSDSGIEEGGTPLDKQTLGAQAAQLCHDLTTIVHLTADFCRDVVDNTENPKELLDELETKIHPFLVTLDEEMTASEKVLRWNIDHSSIGDARVGWLLKYNRYQLEFRRVLTELSGPMYDDVYRVLRLRDRGCQGLMPQKQTAVNLKEMAKGLCRADGLIQAERAQPETAYN